MEQKTLHNASGYSTSPAASDTTAGPLMPALTVIIVSWNVKALLRNCLASLFAQSGFARGELDMTVIVVDNASADGTCDMVRAEFPQVVLIDSSENLGFGAANTLAFDSSGNEFVLLLNPDTLVPDGTVYALLAKLASDSNLGALGCRLENADGSLQRWTGGYFPTLATVATHYLLPAQLIALAKLKSVYLSAEPESDAEVDWLCGACIILRRSKTLRPLFDPAYWLYGEDIDMCYRLKTTGAKVIYSPELSITHFQGASISQQSGDALLSSLNGMRQFYGRRANRLQLFIFDLLTVTGFALRASAYGLAAITFRNEAMWRKFKGASKYLGIATKLMRSAKPPPSKRPA